MGNFHLTNFTVFQIIANNSVSPQFVEAGGLESLFRLAGSHLAVSALPDILISEEEKATGMERRGLNH